MRIFETVKGSPEQFKELEPINFSPDSSEVEMQLLMIYKDIEYQEIKGFGGAFTEAAADSYYKMNVNARKEILQAYFAETGLNYSCGRTHIGSCDFSFGNYNYCEQPDRTLSSFSIDCDRSLLLPFIKECQTAATGIIQLMSSPWSPPAWMKDNNQLLGGGKLKADCYQVWADYFVRYINAYKAEGIIVDMVSVQNEPKAVQRWESCIYTAEEEKVFIRDFLYPTLCAAGLGAVKIIIWDHNKEQTFERARHIMADEKARTAVYGIGFHWYSGDHFENLRLCKQFFPEQELVFTEGCVELSAGSPTNEGGNENVIVSESPWEFGEKYAYDMIGNINAGLSTYFDWNLLLNEQGGPNHLNNFCSAPIICDTINQKVIYQPSYYFLGHFTKYVPVGSKRVAHSKYTNKLSVSTFITPAGEVVAVLLNQTSQDVPVCIKDVATTSIAYVNIKAQSITTLKY